MRYFLTGRSPDPHRILLVESGARPVMQRAIAGMEKAFPGSRFELCTCYAGLPAGDPGIEQVWRVTDAITLGAKLRMAIRMARSRPPVAAMLFSGDPIMFPWKMLLLFLLPSKILLINENGDFFWLDRKNLSTLRQFVGSRLGMNGEGMLRSLCRFVTFPFVFLFLLLAAAITYGARWTRLLYWKVAGLQ